MATVQWTGGGPSQTQVETATVTGVAAGGTLTATIGVHSVTYVCTSGDTTASAAQSLFNLLTAAGVPGEFAELVYDNPSNGVITVTSPTSGYPFTIAFVGGLGASISQAHTTANLSPSDVTLAANWLRNGVAALPQNGDDLVIANSSIPLLWNLDKLFIIPLSVTRYQSFTGTIGLPDQNPAGYLEYRATDLTLGTAGSSSSLGGGGGGGGSIPAQTTMLLGAGTTGGGPGRERYNLQGQKTVLTVLASGSALDATAVRFRGTNGANTVSVVSTSLGIALGATETSSFSSAVVGGGGTLVTGGIVTVSGAVTVTGGSAVLASAPPTLNALSGSQITVTAAEATFPAILAANGSQFTWLSDSTVTTLTLRTGSFFDKSQDPRAMTITNLTIDVDTAVVNDPMNTITYTNAAVCNNAASGGPFLFGSGRTLKLT
jgi:hypothetical protein